MSSTDQLRSKPHGKKGFDSRARCPHVSADRKGHRAAACQSCLPAKSLLTTSRQRTRPYLLHICANETQCNGKSQSIWATKPVCGGLSHFKCQLQRVDRQTWTRHFVPFYHGEANELSVPYVQEVAKDTGGGNTSGYRREVGLGFSGKLVEVQVRWQRFRGQPVPQDYLLHIDCNTRVSVRLRALFFAAKHNAFQDSASARCDYGFCRIYAIFRWGT